MTGPRPKVPPIRHVRLSLRWDYPGPLLIRGDTQRRHSTAWEGFNGSGYEYFRNPTWWTGMIMQLAGEVFNLAAYTFAPAVLVATLGALCVLTGTVLGAYFLGERLEVVGRPGCAICLVCSVLIVANAPPDKKVGSIDEMLEFAARPDTQKLSLLAAMLSQSRNTYTTVLKNLSF